MLYVFAILVIIAIVAGYFLSAAVVLWLARLFKVVNFSYKDSLKITLLTEIAGFILKIVFGVINLGIISSIIITIGTFLAFSYLLKKYQANWKKALGIFACLGVIAAVVSLAIVIPVRMLVIQPFYARGGAMEPSLSDYDYLFINMMNKQYKRGDIVVFKYPKNPNQYFIKRIIGLPGENIEIKDSQVIVNGTSIAEGYLSNGTETLLPASGGFGSISLKNNEYFLLGDNRSRSLDSRVFGPVDASLLVGKIWFELYPQYQEFK